MTLQFKKATREQGKLRLALVGPSGSGKTYTALTLATALSTKVAVIDTEHGSASKYAGDPFEFDVLELQSMHPDRYVEAIEAAERAGYEVLVIDSLSHAWSGKDGALETVDKAKQSFTEGWRNVTPAHNRMVDKLVSAGLHIIATMRAKTEYTVETDSRGKQVPRKIGLAPVQRAGMEYEFDVLCDIDLDHNLTVSKTRCAAIDGLVVNKAGAPLARQLQDWLGSGAPVEYATPDQLAEMEAMIQELAGGDDGKVTRAHGQIQSEFSVATVDRLRQEHAAQVLARLSAAIEGKRALAASQEAPSEPTVATESRDGTAG